MGLRRNAIRRPVVAVAAPVLSALVQYWAREAWDYRIGFELLIYNAAFTDESVANFTL